MAFVRVRNRVTGQQKPMSLGMANALRDKYEIISGGNVADEPVSNVEEIPNLQPAVEKKTADAESESDELKLVRAQYEALYGEKPHGRLKVETLKKLIAEKNEA